MIDNIFEEIKSRVKVQDVLQHYGIQVRGNRCLCIWHDDHNPSASVTNDNNSLHCFACGKTGDIFHIVMTLEKCSLKKAISIIDEKFKLGLVHELSPEEREAMKKADLRRQKQRQERQFMAALEHKTIQDVASELRFWENAEKLTLKLKGQIEGKDRCDSYFYAVERQRWLNWLYETLCGFTDKQETEWDYTIGNDKKKVLRMIYNNEIII